jgi:hypothetical protein
MRLSQFILIFSLFAACNVPTIKDENSAEEKSFELESVAINIYDTLTLAKGIKAEIIDSLSWPSCLVTYKGGLIIGQNPQRLTGDLKETVANNNPKIKYYNLPNNESPINAQMPGYQTAMCEAPWGGILIATTGQKRFEKGYIYHFNNGVLTRLDALGSASFTGVTAHQTENGKAIIYYSDFTPTNSNLYKFVANKGTDCNQGDVYAAKLPSFGWMLMNRETQPELSKKYKTDSDILSHLNEATRVVGYISNYAVAGVTFDKNDGTIKYANMPLIHKNYLYGSVDYIFENGGQFEGTSFHYKPYILAGARDYHSHLAQITIDDKNGVWICTGMSIDDIGNEVYQPNGGNAILLMPKTGVQSNLKLRVAVAPQKGRFSGLILDKKQHCIYTALQDQQGKGVLLKLTGPSVEKLLE